MSTVSTLLNQTKKSIENIETNIMNDCKVNITTNVDNVVNVDNVNNNNVNNYKKRKNTETNEEVIDIKEDVKFVDFNLMGVKDLQKSLGNSKYSDIRVGLYRKYGIVSKDEENVPGVYMITYNKPGKISSKVKINLTKEQHDVVSQYRGVIVEKNTNKPLCYTFNKMSRHLPEEWDLKDCVVTKSYDGSQIKLFYYNNKWVVSTTRKIDANNSFFFSDKSFLEMFNDSTNKPDYSKLNKDYCYSFVLAHPDNRVVARHNTACLTHVLTRNMKTYKLVDVDIGVTKPDKVTFKSKTDMWKSVKNLPYFVEGYVVQNGSSFVKVVNTKYQSVKDLRGNSNSLLLHYFTLKKKNKIKEFLTYYPETNETFRFFEKSFNNLCLLAYNEYVLLRIRKVITVDKLLVFLKPVLYKIHGIHITKKIRIKQSVVRQHLNEYPSFLLKKLVELANNLPYSFY
jgi:hypothetical protein